MRLSPSLAASSAVAVLSTALLCALSGTAVSQITTGQVAPLPSITVDAPKQAAKPQSLKRQATTGPYRRTSSSDHTRSRAAQAPSFAPDSVMGRIAKLERSSSSCNGGCETSFRQGNAPWVGCSLSVGENSTGAFSSTCRDTLTYKTYAECTDTKIFIGWISREARWHCSSLLAAGKLAGEKQQVAESARR
ncbi:hypothetical protein FNJ47_18295 [Bradyrhizobium sp. UFLA 03-164]|uniref:Uncharacterized protein n=1 Tax=Bradyrhizobium uaiense TaxID=2594946 RepID=A0A6P1BHN0_9BRAD|nr:hypothetical protein [Bradyrhizobium uaiense]